MNKLKIILISSFVFIVSCFASFADDTVSNLSEVQYKTYYVKYYQDGINCLATSDSDFYYNNYATGNVVLCYGTFYLYNLDTGKLVGSYGTRYSVLEDRYATILSTNSEAIKPIVGTGNGTEGTEQDKEEDKEEDKDNTVNPPVVAPTVQEAIQKILPVLLEQLQKLLPVGVAILSAILSVQLIKRLILYFL